MSEKETTEKHEPGIYVFSKPVVATHGVLGNALDLITTLSTLKNAHHLYLLKIDKNQNKYIIRGGPKGNGILGSLLNGKIDNEIDIPFEKSYDFYEKGSKDEKRYWKKLNVAQKEIDRIWDNMKKTAEDIQHKGSIMTI